MLCPSSRFRCLSGFARCQGEAAKVLFFFQEVQEGQAREEEQAQQAQEEVTDNPIRQKWRYDVLKYARRNGGGGALCMLSIVRCSQLGLSRNKKKEAPTVTYTQGRVGT